MTIRILRNDEDPFEVIEKDRLEADQKSDPSIERHLVVGSFFKRAVEIYTTKVTIYGEILDPCTGLEDEEDIEETREIYAAPEMAHFRFTRGYSALCPQGEMGDTHTSVMTPISREEFLAAKAKGWVY